MADKSVLKKCKSKEAIGKDKSNERKNKNVDKSCERKGKDKKGGGTTKRLAVRTKGSELTLTNKVEELTVRGKELTDFKKKRVAETDKPTSDQKAKLNEFVEKYIAIGVTSLVASYEKEIKPILPRTLNPKARVAFDANMDKNRYADVVCLEHTRVVLKDGKGSEYIHANYIRGEPLVNTFIATQGPINKTSNDFWRLVVQEKCRHIFMLCQLEENGRMKCERYWPQNPTEKMTIGDFTITNIEVSKPDAHVVLSRLQVEDPTGNKWLVDHHNWITWPDKSTPKSLLAVFRLLKYARSSRYDCSVVHCSAGIGRTGTFVAIEYILQKILSLKNNADLIQSVLEIRDMRMSSIQVEVQFIYIIASIGKFAQSMGALSSDVETKYKTFITAYDEYVAKRMAQATGAIGGEGCKALEIAGGQNFTQLPPGVNPSSFAVPDGAGTGFSLDDFKGSSETTKKKEPKLELAGGKTFSQLPAGVNPADFAVPDGAGTGFSMDSFLTTNKPVTLCPATTNRTQTKLEIAGGQTMATLPPGAKGSDFPTPDAAGTGFNLFADATDKEKNKKAAPVPVPSMLPNKAKIAPPTGSPAGTKRQLQAAKQSVAPGKAIGSKPSATRLDKKEKTVDMKTQASATNLNAKDAKSQKDHKKRHDHNQTTPSPLSNPAKAQNPVPAPGIPVSPVQKKTVDGMVDVENPKHPVGLPFVDKSHLVDAKKPPPPVTASTKNEKEKNVSMYLGP